jgi:hypothetical protein
MTTKRSAEARKREFWWIVGTIAVLLLLAAAVQIALPFLSALAANF